MGGGDLAAMWAKIPRLFAEEQIAVAAVRPAATGTFGQFTTCFNSPLAYFSAILRG